MNIPINGVERRLNLVGNKWLRWLGGQGNSQASEVSYYSLFSKLWPVKVLSQPEENLITQRILAKLRKKGRLKYRLVLLGELFLVVIALVFVMGLGRLISGLTPEQTPKIVYHTYVVNNAVEITQTPGQMLQPTPYPDEAILYEAEGGETLGEIADRNFLNVTIIEALNNIPANQPLEAGQSVMIGVTDSQRLVPTFDGNLLTQSKPLTNIKPLTKNSNQEEIRQRVMQSRDHWLTLWAEGLVVQYGPSGYVGEPEIRRQQIWIIQPFFNYLLDGENGGEVDYIYTSIGGLVNLLNLRTGDEVSSNESERIHFLPDLQQMLLSSEYRENLIGDLDIIGLDSIAGREVLVFDWISEPGPKLGLENEGNSPRTHQGRYWVDTIFGLILRIQRFNGNDPTQLFEETFVTKIKINVPIPDHIFGHSQPSQMDFAQDHQGNRGTRAAPVPGYINIPQTSRSLIRHKSPPSNFAVQESNLTFQWTSLESFNPLLGTRIDLFGDGYFLGNIEFPDPRQIHCIRSPDGNLIAYFGWSEELPLKYSPVGWINLQNILQVNQPLSELVPYDFAFSPDNQQLAVYGCLQEGDQECGIYLVDITSGETIHLTTVEVGSGLIWKPDSSALAIQGSFLRPGMKRGLVFDAETGVVLHDGPFDWEGFWVTPDSPLHDWGVPYPPIRGGLELCSSPP
jgi:hypothetical protein